MYFNIRFGALLNQKTYSPCLIPGKILVNDTTTRQDQREFLIWNFLRRVELNCMKLRLAVGMIKAVFEQSGSTRMVLRRTRPEDSVVLLDLLPGYSIVISVAA